MGILCDVRYYVHKVVRGKIERTVAGGRGGMEGGLWLDATPLCLTNLINTSSPGRNLCQFAANLVRARRVYRPQSLASLSCLSAVNVVLNFCL